MPTPARAPASSRRRSRTSAASRCRRASGTASSAPAARSSRRSTSGSSSPCTAHGPSHCRDELSPLLFLARSARVYPARTAVVDEERTFTYAQLAERVDSLGRALRGAGIEPGDRVAALSPNRAELLEAHFGVPACGGVLCAINTRLAGPEIAQILTHSCAKLVLCDPGLRHLVPDDVRVIELGDALRGAPRGRIRAGPLEAWPDNEERPISVNYTSGTTGRPEGRDVQPPRRLPRRARAGHRHGPRPRQPLPVDASHVPLQRLDVSRGRSRRRAARTSACARSSPRGSGTSCGTGSRTCAALRPCWSRSTRTRTRPRSSGR